MSSEIVFIRRKDGRYGVPAEVSAMNRKAIGSYMRNGRVGIPMDISGDTDQVKWNRAVLGDLLNCPSYDVNFNQKVNEYFMDISIQVIADIDGNDNPTEGTKFEIGLDENGYPLDVLGYVQYQHCVHHPEVTLDKQRCISEKHLLYYVDRPAERQKLLAGKLEERENAIIKFAEVKANKPELIDWILSYKKYNPESMDPNEKIIAMNKLIDEDPALFLELSNDPKLEIRTMIENLIDRERIQVIEGEYFFGDVKLGGGGIKAAIAFIQKPTNTAVFNSIKAEFKNRFVSNI